VEIEIKLIVFGTSPHRSGLLVALLVLNHPQPKYRNLENQGEGISGGRFFLESFFPMGGTVDWK